MNLVGLRVLVIQRSTTGKPVCRKTFGHNTARPAMLQFTSWSNSGRKEVAVPISMANKVAGMEGIRRQGKGG